MASAFAPTSLACAALFGVGHSQCSLLAFVWTAPRMQELRREF